MKTTRPMPEGHLSGSLGALGVILGAALLAWAILLAVGIDAHYSTALLGVLAWHNATDFAARHLRETQGS